MFIKTIVHLLSPLDSMSLGFYMDTTLRQMGIHYLSI